jgi:UDPglucose 6-dehydrogenase
MREAPSLAIIGSLQKMGAKIRAYDPASMEEAAKVLKDVEYFTDSYDVAKGSDAVVIITEWPQFRNLDLEKLKRVLKQPNVIDLRNVYDPARMREMGFNYTCVGRPR